jgi:RHS repeat-associated protein
LTTGSGWQSGTAGTGFGDDYLKTSGAASGKTARWTMDGLASGAYLVYAAYLPSASNTAAALYNLYDGTKATGTLEHQGTVNQRIAPNGLVVSGQNFGYVSQINVGSGTLTVELDASNLSGGLALADAIYVVPATLGAFFGFSSPGDMVTGSAASVTTRIVDPDGQLANSINVYRDTDGNGVLDVGVDQLLSSDTNPSDGLNFDASTLATGSYHLFVAAMNAGGVVTSTATTVTAAEWWKVKITHSRTKGEAKFESYEDLHVETDPVKLDPGQGWDAAVWKAVRGTVRTENTEQPDTYYYSFAPGAGAYKVGTYQGLQGQVGGKFNPFQAGNEPAPTEKLIVLEDLYFSNDPKNPNDSDYDDQYWVVTVTPVPVTPPTDGPDKPGTCSCTCSCSAVGTTESGDPSLSFPLGGDISAVTNAGTLPHPILRAPTKLPVEYATAPDSVEVHLTFGGVDQGTVYYSTAGHAPGDDVVFAMQPDATGLSTGHYDWEMAVLYKYGTQTVPRVFTGTQDVISRTGSELGRGFSIPELDRLDVRADGANLVTGDNHAIWYFRTGSSTFVREAGDLTFSTLVKNTDGSYTITAADGSKSNFGATGLLVSRVDPTGNTRAYSYNPNGTISTITDAAGRVTTFNYTGDHVSSVVGFDGTVTALAHDSAGNLVSVTQPDPDGAGPQSAPVSSYTYDATTGLLATTTDPRGGFTTIAYDHAGLVSQVTQPDGDHSTFSMFRSLGVVDRSVSGSSPSNPASLVSSNAPEIQHDEHGNPTQIRRDRFGNVVWQQDALGNVTTFERNADGLVTKLTQPDPDGTGPLGQLVTRFEYDSRGNLTKRINPDFTIETWTYDPTFSNPTSYIDALGRRSLWSIDPATGLVLSMTQVVGAFDSSSNGETDDVTTSFTYTTGSGGVPAGLTATMTDALGRVTSYTYTTRGLLASMTQAVGTPDQTTTSFEYDASDNLTAMIDGLGRRTEYAYDKLNRLISMTQGIPSGAGPAISFWQFAYDARGNRTSMIDPLGNVTSYTYDEHGRLIGETKPDPDGAGPLTAPATAATFDGMRLVSMADALGRTTTYDYDALDRMIRATRPDPDGAGPLAAPVTQTTYNSVGWVTSTIDPRGNATGFAYDAMGRVLTVTGADPDGTGPLTAPVTSYTYDAAGQVLTVTDPLGRVTTFAYVDLGRVASMTQPDPDGAGPLTAPVTLYGYDKLGNRTSVTDPLGHVTLYVYDSLYRLVQKTEADPDGAGPLVSPVTTYVFDAASQLVSTTDAMGRTTTYEYDSLGRLVKRTEPDPDGAGPLLAAWTVFVYDAVGNVLSQEDRLGHTTVSAYDNLYRLVSTTDASGGVTAYTYDAVGNRITLTDPSGNTTTWTYDDLDRVIQDQNALGASRYFGYDAAGNLVQKTDRNGRVTQFTFDNLNRKTSEKWMSGSAVVKEFSYSYDVGNQLVGVGDGTADYTYTFDNLSRETQSRLDFAALAQPVTLNQAFDAGSRRTNLFAAIGTTADFKNDFGYDNLNRPATITQQGQSGGNAIAEKRVDFGYNAAGQTNSLTRFADLAGTQIVAASTLGYDGAGQLTSLVHAKGSTVFAGYGFAYDASHRMTSLTNSAYPTEDASYTNDATGQLTGADRTGSSSDEAYAYDANGNRVLANGAAYTTGANNRVLSDGTSTYSYDAEGNITRITNIATGDYRALTWDYRTRLTTVTQFDSTDIEQWHVEYVYDVVNRLIGRTEYANGSSTPSSSAIFVYDGYQMILKLDASGNVLGRTLWGAGVDQILAAEDSSGNVTWPLTDHLNTVRDIVSYNSTTDTTTLENNIVYNSFGEVKSQTHPSVSSDFLFTARYTDATTGLQWNLNRWYVPTIGRWASEDPTGFAAGDPNLARYAGNGPTRAFDSSGLRGEPAVPQPAAPEPPPHAPRAEPVPWWQGGDDWPVLRNCRDGLRNIGRKSIEALRQLVDHHVIDEKLLAFTDEEIGEINSSKTPGVTALRLVFDKVVNGYLDGAIAVMRKLGGNDKLDKDRECDRPVIDFIEKYLIPKIEYVTPEQADEIIRGRREEGTRLEVYDFFRAIWEYKW